MSFIYGVAVNATAAAGAASDQAEVSDTRRAVCKHEGAEDEELATPEQCCTT